MTATVDRITWFGTPAVVTLCLHLAVIALVLVRWTGPATIEARVIQPVAIKATLVDAQSLQSKPKSTSVPVSKPKPKPKPRAKPQPKPEPKPQSAVPPQSQPAAVVDTPDKAPEQTDTPLRLTEQELARQSLADIESLLASDQRSEASVVASPSDTAAAIIRRAVIGRWTRPPSARNGMVAVLEIALVPTGDVVGVTVLESSGNVAFDRSAMNAVDKVGRFPEVSALERAVFERDFRRFQLIFRPEDLRY